MLIRKRGRTIQSLDDWKKLAGPRDPEKQWKAGRSAMQSAIAWLEIRGAVPPEIQSLFKSHPDFGDLTVDWIEPEASIPFDRYAGPRQADIAVRAHDARGPVAITVEAKADEPFDEPVAEVLAGALDRLLSNKRSRGFARVIKLVQALLGPKTQAQADLGALRYQLFTGVGGTLAMANQEKAARAVFVVHEIVTHETSQKKLAANADDYAAFIRRIANLASTPITAGTLYGPIHVPGAPLFKTPAALYIGKASRFEGTPKP